MTPRIGIAIPTHDHVPAMFMFDLANLTAFTVAALPDSVALGMSMVTATYVHDARMQLAALAVRNELTHLLWLDSDMRFPRDALVRLLQHDKDVVGTNYAKRGVPSDYVAIKRVGRPGVKLVTTDESTGLEEVEALGFGCVLMQTEAFRHLPDSLETPWFQHEYLGDATWMGEDVFFCRLLREAGVTLWVDHDLSKSIKHIGTLEYTLAHAAMEREGEATT